MPSPYRTRLLLGALLACRLISPAPAEEAKKDDILLMEKFVAGDTTFDPAGIITTKPIGFALGFDKTIMETPRSITVVTQQQLDSFAIRNTEDLSKVVPGVYTTFRFGLQGNPSIRNQASDMYFRGMKRIDPSGNWKTVWGVADSLDIVRGPASPIFGMGRIGGYVNFNPKTGRATTGKYLENPSGTVKATYGSYDKQIISGDISGPVKLFGHDAGYSVYAYKETGGSYRINNRDQKQESIQATLTADLTKSWRVETGMVLASSFGGMDGGNNRTLRHTASDKTYWHGNFTYQLDEDGNGMISQKEVRNSYFRGTAQLSVLRTDPLSNATNRTQIGPSLVYNPTTNDELYRTVPWQGAPVPDGKSPTITMAQFKAGYLDTSPTLVGKAPVQRMGYQLMVYPSRADGTPNTAAAKVPFFLPPSYDLNPDSFKEVSWNSKMSLGENWYRARTQAYYFDVVNDYTPGQTAKFQTFLDTYTQRKHGNNGFSSTKLSGLSLEGKFTFTKQFNPAKWWSLNTLTSVNWYTIYSNNLGGNGTTDSDWRRDLQLNDNNPTIESTFTSNDRFQSTMIDNSYDTGWPRTSALQTRQMITGGGLLLDQSFFRDINLILGFRYDYVDSYVFQGAGVYERGTSTPTTDPYSNTGLINPNSYSSYGNSSKPTMSASLSYHAPFGFLPYVTVGKQGGLIGGNITTNRTNLMGTSTLLEAGLKSVAFKGRLNASVAVYDQTRASFEVAQGEGAGQLSSTVSRGIEAEVRFLVSRHLSVSINGNWAKQESLSSPGTILFTARDAGYPDVVDANGKILIPAEAFAWGGRFQTNIPRSVAEYNEVVGVPDHVISATANYNFTSGYYIGMSMYDQGKLFGNQLKTIIVPEAYTFDLNAGFRGKQWSVYAVVTNIFKRDMYSSGGGTGIGWINLKNVPAIDINVARRF